MSSHFLGTANITFLKVNDREDILKRFRSRSWINQLFRKHLGRNLYRPDFQLSLQHRDRQQTVTVEASSAPQDVVWKDLAIGQKQKEVKDVITMMVVVATIVTNFAIIFYIKYLALEAITGSSYVRGNQYTGLSPQSVANLFVTVSIMLANQGLRHAIRALVENEHHKTYSSQTYYKTRKMWRAQFIIKGILPAAVAISLMDFYGTNGFIYTITTLMITQAIIVPL